MPLQHLRHQIRRRSGAEIAQEDVFLPLPVAPLAEKPGRRFDLGEMALQIGRFQPFIAEMQRAEIEFEAAALERRQKRRPR